MPTRHLVVVFSFKYFIKNGTRKSLQANNPVTNISDTLMFLREDFFKIINRLELSTSDGASLRKADA